MAVPEYSVIMCALSLLLVRQKWLLLTQTVNIDYDIKWLVLQATGCVVADNFPPLSISGTFYNAFIEL
jgi:hypothetical protein